MSVPYLDAIREFEGFTPQASWDYAQFSNGYGTKAKFAGEVIDKAEADRRFQAEIAEARAIVERHAPDATEGTKAALTSLTFNAGDKWTRSGLGDAVRDGDTQRARDLFVQYNKAGGEVLPGLVKRRLAEAAWMDVPATPGATSVGAAGDAAAVPVVAVADVAAPSGPPSRSEPEPPTAMPVRRDPVAALVDDVAFNAGREGAPISASGVDVARVATAAAGFAGEARLTQLLLATRLLGSASSQREDEAPLRKV